MALSRVWTITPTFRAERSATNRHLAEFRMLEAEMAFTASLEEVMATVQGSVAAGIRAAILADDHSQGAKALLDGTLIDCEASLLLPLADQEPSSESAHPSCERLARWAKSEDPWPRLTHSQAVERIQAHGGLGSLVWGDSLSSEQERWLAADAGNCPIFVTDYPAKLKPFYMRVNASVDAEEATVACFDLLVPGLGELAGGSLREEREETLLAQMKVRGMTSETIKRLDWYVSDLRRFGAVPHGGFGLGVERLISWVTQVENVRDCVAFPRVRGPVRF